MLDRDDYRALCDARIFEPASLQRALRDRPRRTLAGTDGNLLILAADHTARGMIAVGSDPLAVADRYTLLDNLMRGLSVPGVDGVMASADILEELAWLGALDGRLARRAGSPLFPDAAAVRARPSAACREPFAQSSKRRSLREGPRCATIGRRMVRQAISSIISGSMTARASPARPPAATAASKKSCSPAAQPSIARAARSESGRIRFVVGPAILPPTIGRAYKPRMSLHPMSSTPALAISVTGCAEARCRVGARQTGHS